MISRIAQTCASVAYDAGLFFCAAVWGATFYMVKDALGAVDPVALVAYRFLIAALALLPWALSRKKPFGLIREGAVLAFLLTTLYVSQTIGLLYTSASNSGFITGLFILFVPLFLLALGQPPTRSQWAAVAVALGGLWILTGGVKNFNRGDAMTLLAASAYAGHLLATDRCVKGSADTVLLAFHQFWITALACLILASSTGRSLEVNSGKAAGVILFLALAPTLMAFFVQMIAQRHTAPVKVALIFTLEPVFAALFAWTLGGETFRAAGAVGGVFIVAAMAASELSNPALLSSRKREVLPV